LASGLKPEDKNVIIILTKDLIKQLNFPVKTDSSKHLNKK